jgi:predicted XRE-type DNA-binding protein
MNAVPESGEHCGFLAAGISSQNERNSKMVDITRLHAALDEALGAVIERHHSTRHATHGALKVLVENWKEITRKGFPLRSIAPDDLRNTLNVLERVAKSAKDISDTNQTVADINAALDELNARVASRGDIPHTATAGALRELLDSWKPGVNCGKLADMVENDLVIIRAILKKFAKDVASLPGYGEVFRPPQADTGKKSSASIHAERDAEAEAALKVAFCLEIAALGQSRGLDNEQLAELACISKEKVDKLVDGNAEDFSAWRLMRVLNRLGRNVTLEFSDAEAECGEVITRASADLNEDNKSTGRAQGCP